MGERTGIAWTDHTASPWHGCAKVSPGCENCYAAATSVRNPKTLGVWGTPNQGGTRVPSKGYASKLLRWNRMAREAGVQRKVFPSICDPFEDFPGLDEQRVILWPRLESTPNLIHLLLTKRPENVLRMVPPEWTTPYLDVTDPWPRNVWIGTTAEDQKRADERIPHLLRVPAPVRFVSVEPQLGFIELTRLVGFAPGIQWVIQGGESGPHSRRFRVDWARELRDECDALGVAYFFKQMGSVTVTRNDDFFEGEADGTFDGEPAWPAEVTGNGINIEHDINGFREEHQGADCRVKLQHRAGADPTEWPADLRVQQFPETR